VRPDRVAVKVDDSELSYAALDEAAARAADLLRAKGVQPGDRVEIMLPNVAYFAVATPARCAPARPSCR
jgi:long-chain acyl-CoA synthetase